MIQEIGTLLRIATPIGRHVQQSGTPIDEYEQNLRTLSRPDRVFIYYSHIDVEANRVNLAIVSRPIIGIRDGSDAFFQYLCFSQ